jgi:hypothetical protein
MGYPPKRNRLEEALPLLRIEVHHADGVFVADPNGMAVAGCERALDALRPLPGRASALSGEPGVLWRSHDVEAVLTPAELGRLARLSLRPDEVLALIERFGVVHEWHDDFYDLDTGEALQPVYDDEYAADIAALRGATGPAAFLTQGEAAALAATDPEFLGELERRYRDRFEEMEDNDILGAIAGLAQAVGGFRARGQELPRALVIESKFVAEEATRRGLHPGDGEAPASPRM